MNFKIILRLLLCVFVLSTSSGYASTTPPATTIIPGGDIYKKIATLKLKDIQRITGKKITLKQKIGFFFLKKKMKNAGDEGSKKGSAAQTFGFIGLALLILGLVFPIAILGALVAAILAIAKGSAASKVNPNDKNAHAGKILGWITLGLFGLLLLIAVVALSSLGIR